MEIRRFTTAETPTGVVTQTDNVLDTASRESTDVINIWGFDAVPGLPLRPEHVLGAFQQMGAFGPLGGIRVDLFIIPPVGDEPPDLAETVSKIDLGTGGGMVPGAEGGGMHRTDTIDFVTVIEGETNVAYPDHLRLRVAAGHGQAQHRATALAAWAGDLRARRLCARVALDTYCLVAAPKSRQARLVPAGS